MDDMQTFERRVAGEVIHGMGPSEPVDDAAIFTTITATRSPKWRFQSMFSATKFVVAGVIVALFGGFLLVGGFATSPDDEDMPAVGASATPQASVSIVGGDEYATLAEAVDAAVDGDTIELGPGTHAGSVVIGKDIMLMGVGPVEEIIVAVEAGPVLTLDGAAASVSGITFTGPTSDGVRVAGGSVVLEDLVFRDVGEPFIAPPCTKPCRSLDIDAGAQAIVRDNTFVGGGEIIVDGASVVEIEGNSLTGGPHIALFELGPGSVVRNNTIVDSSSRGIGLYAPTDIFISGNTISNVPEYGITVGWASGGAGIDPQIVANTISASGNGIDVARSANPILTRNVLFDNGVGILVRGSDAMISGNDLSGNGQGIVVMGGSPTLQENAVMLGTSGLMLSSAATPELIRNTICDNDQNVTLTGDAQLPEGGDNEVCQDTPAE